MTISIIGGGNMGGALARGFAQTLSRDQYKIFVADPNQSTLTALQEQYEQITVTTDNKVAVKAADWIFVAVKPWLLAKVADEITPFLNPTKQTLVSIVAGADFETLTALFAAQDNELPIFRLIPNTAISIKESMSLIAAYRAPQSAIELLTQWLNHLGKALVVEERLMAAGTALGSCGTAYAMRYIQAAMLGGVELGFYPHQAQMIVEQTVIGAARLLSATGNHPAIEIDKVTTPGGITIKGLNAMEEAGFTNAIIKGLKASK